MKQVYWTEYELDCIRKYYPKHGAVFVDEIIFRKYGRRRGRRNVMKKAMLMGVRFIGEHRTRFRPGIVPANTGKKPSAQTMEKLQRTFFPKGHLPHNTRPKGDDVSVRWKDGSPTVYLRIALGNWVPLARHTYQSYYGPIPPKHMVTFIDGDPMNCDIKNLRLMSFAENVRRNHNTKKISADARNLTDRYVLSYFKRYEHVDISMEDAKATGLIEVMRTKIKLKRSLKKSN